MDDTRYERLDLEARISALEAEVRLITAESVRAQSPPSPTVTEPTVIDDPADARHVAGAPNVSPSSEKTRALEKTLGGRGLQFAGLLLILFGAAFFLDLAATRRAVGSDRPNASCLDLRWGPDSSYLRLAALRTYTACLPNRSSA
jgi:uncharacterized membrane protein